MRSCPNRFAREARRSALPLAALAALVPLAAGCAAAADAPDPPTVTEAPVLVVGTIGGGTNIPPPLIVAPPYGLVRTASPRSCLAHADGGYLAPWICSRNLDLGNLVLTWSWWNLCPRGNTCATTIDRYDVYESVNGGVPVKITDVPGAQTYAAVGAPSSGVHTCYSVAAVSGAVSSRTSASWCTDGMTPNVLSRRVDPRAYNTWHNWYRGDRMVGPWDVLASAQIAVGFTDAYDGGDWFHAAQTSYDWWRGGVVFDLGDPAMREPQGATLAFHSQTSTARWGSLLNCAIDVDVLDEPITYGYWSIPNLALANGWPKSHPLTTASNATSEVSVRVDAVVADWIQGRATNDGFSLRGPRETTDADSTTCVSSLSDLHLQIDYYDQTAF